MYRRPGSRSARQSTTVASAKRSSAGAPGCRPGQASRVVVGPARRPPGRGRRCGRTRSPGRPDGTREQRSSQSPARQQEPSWRGRRGASGGLDLGPRGPRAAPVGPSSRYSIRRSSSSLRSTSIAGSSLTSSANSACRPRTASGSRGPRHVLRRVLGLEQVVDEHQRGPRVRAFTGTRRSVPTGMPSLHVSNLRARGSSTWLRTLTMSPFQVWWIRASPLLMFWMSSVEIAARVRLLPDKHSWTCRARPGPPCSGRSR